MISIDEVCRIAAYATLQKTAEQLPGDDLSSKRNFVDTTRNSIEYLNNQARKKFKELKFIGIVLRAQSITTKQELEASTSHVFANSLLESSLKDNTKKIWRLFVHIPEVSGLLPQPSYQDVERYRAGALQEFDKFKYETTTALFPKFYCASDKAPNVMDIWKVSFHDENFMYYGKALSFHTSAGALLQSQ